MRYLLFLVIKVPASDCLWSSSVQYYDETAEIIDFYEDQSPQNHATSAGAFLDFRVNPCDGGAPFESPHVEDQATVNNGLQESVHGNGSFGAESTHSPSQVASHLELTKTASYQGKFWTGVVVPAYSDLKNRRCHNAALLHGPIRLSNLTHPFHGGQVSVPMVRVLGSTIGKPC